MGINPHHPVSRPPPPTEPARFMVLELRVLGCNRSAIVPHHELESATVVLSYLDQDTLGVH
jgi:hypothetical protein